MAGEVKVLDLLEAVQAYQRDAGHGWAADAVLMPVNRRVLNLADREERAALSA
ncbi:hypothetical protein ABZ490_50425 [Streptomyces sp. NPDC005811]|uniref:hypothetical protein n=1 Tax=Streptomyces sp. NPDC005811 TaxID=3154565 RepID=UPI0033E84CC1